MIQRFDAQIDEWVAQTKQRMRAVFQIATQELCYGILKPMSEGGRMRIDTGFLRASFTTSLNSPTLALNPRPDGDDKRYTLDLASIGVTIAQADIGDTIYGMFTASYARPREYGARGKPGDGFVLTNVARWQDYVNEAAAHVKASI